MLAAGPQFAGLSYRVVGTLGDARTGDPYLEHLLAHPEQAPLWRASGVLDASGAATATFMLPANAPANLAGRTLRHSFVVLQPSGQRAFTSNAVSLVIVE